MSEYRSIAKLPPELRPYEKCEKYGPSVLSDPELLAVILKTGSKEKSAVDLAEDILYPSAAEGGLRSLYKKGLNDYRQLKGIGRVKALQLVCLTELSRRMAKDIALNNLDIKNSSSVADYYMEDLRHCSEEKVFAMLLDIRCRLIASELVSQGTVNSSAVSPREIFITALRYGAAGFILVHNHPSGDPEPSKEDIVFTKQLHELGRMMNIQMKDSIIIGDNCYCSLLERGYIS